MCTHNQCFEQKLEKYNIFSSENEHFYSREILLYITRTCFHNVKLCSCAQADLHYCCSLMSKTGLNRCTNGKTQFEPRCGKTGFLHMRKQRRRSASR